MINARFVTSKKIELTSSTKAATATKYSTYWNLKYESNGRMKSFDNYQDILDHLNKAGW